MKKTFYLIDGHAQIFRAYYAPFQLSSSPTGEPVKATHTFTQMLLGLLRDRRPDYLAMAMDIADETTERARVYPQYKANREQTPEDFHPQVQRIVQIVKMMGIPIFQAEGYEADDVIATIASRIASTDVEIFIVSRDKDLYQLLSDRVKLWDPVKDEVIGPEALREKHGFGPQEAVEVQVLTGDSIDNIPGVRGVGEKTAAALIAKYGSAEGVFAHAGELTPKLRENVATFQSQAPLTRLLVTLKKDLPLDFELETCRAKPLPAAALRSTFEELGFRRLLAQLESLAQAGGLGQPDGASGAATSAGAAPPQSAQKGPMALPVDLSGFTVTPAGHYNLVDTPAAFEEFLSELSRQKVFAVDTETTSLAAVDCDLVGISFSWQEGKGYYLPLRSRHGPVLPLGTTLERLKPILEDPRIGKWGQNLKYDIESLLTAGIRLQGVQFDSMIASYLIFPERRSHGMDALARDLLHHRTIPITDLIGTGKNQISMLDVETRRLADYAGEDADITWRLCKELRSRLDASPMKSLFYDVELPLAEVLAAMEYQGIRIDADLLSSISASMGKRLDELREQIYQAAGRPFTIDSPKQLAEVLFDEHGLRSVRKTKTSRSTDAEVLATLAAETAHPLPRLVLEYRELAKLRGTYVDPLPQMISPRTGRLHASFHQTVAATGRLSSSDPNIQNIPIRTDLGKEIRKAFVAADAEHVLISADYSQIELRVLAHLSQDPELVRAFQEDRDIHAFVAAQVAGVPLQQVTREQRSRAKAINFGIIYGQRAFGLARTLGIPPRAAAQFIDAYKRRYPGIVRFMAACVEQAEKTGRVSTLLGRQRLIEGIDSKNQARRAQAERLAINTVVQGTAADMIKVAMVRLHRRIAREGRALRLLIQVHDELVLEARRAEAEEHAAVTREEMAGALPLEVPVRVDVAWGANWLEAKG